MKPGISMSLAILIMALIGFAAQAQAGYPKAKGLYVNDFAKLLTAKDAITIRTALAKLRDDNGVHAVVVTIRSIHGYGTGDQTIESFATNLFNKWGIGDRERNDGVLILVAVKDRKVRIELGSGYCSGYNAQMRGASSSSGFDSGGSSFDSGGSSGGSFDGGSSSGDGASGSW